MRCGYFDAGRCGSCTEILVPYDDQLRRKQAAAQEALAGVAGPADGVRWREPVPSPESGFRNKAKMVVAGTVEAPTLGILDPEGGGVDLRHCGLYSAEVEALLPHVAALIGRARLTPYDVPRRRGELKHVLVTESPDGELMLRFVLRSSEALPRLRKHLAVLLADQPRIAVVTANLQPEHKAVLEGPDETVLTERTTMPMRVDGVPLHLGPRSFFQTNTAIATELYRRVRAWADAAAPRGVLDLYCGVGGFALHLASPAVPGRRVVGVEVSADAVVAARRSATELGVEDAVTFVAGDATAPQPAEDLGADLDLVVVNPPRRGLGAELCAWLDASPATTLVYSSCYAASLARDLAALPTWRPREAVVLDMFPHTRHSEVLVRLTR